MTLEGFLAHCRSKPGVTADYPMAGETVWVKVGGKMFAITNVRAMKMDGEAVAPFHFVNLKCDPARAAALRGTHPAIRPGWHQNKTHWNSVIGPAELSNAFLTELVDHSYDLVFASLPRKIRDALTNGAST